MRYSEIALWLLAAQDCKVIKSNAEFWKNYSNFETFQKEIQKNENIRERYLIISNTIRKIREKDTGIICIFDKEFPLINPKVKNKSEKPFLLCYKGNLSLLHDLNENVAVIGLTDPEEGTIEREKKIVRELCKQNQTIVSGLALGCDTVAHNTALANKGKTIAILPSPLDNIYPPANRELAEKILKKGGLLVTEYFQKSKNPYEMIKRLIERDRLQAMFSKAIVMIASYKKGEGDSGSYYAMKAAYKYGIERYIMYNKELDESNPQFALNKGLKEGYQDIQILTNHSIKKISTLINPDLQVKVQNGKKEIQKSILQKLQM